MFDVKMLNNIDNAVESLERIANSFEKTSAQLEKMTKMNEKCMKLIGVFVDISENMMTKVAQETGDADDPAFLVAKESFATIRAELAMEESVAK